MFRQSRLWVLGDQMLLDEEKELAQELAQQWGSRFAFCTEKGVCS